MDIAETHAGNRTILLRTKTVGPWVLRRGYALIASDQVPANVRPTSEFEGSMFRIPDLHEELAADLS